MPIFILVIVETVAFCIFVMVICAMLSGEVEHREDKQKCASFLIVFSLFTAWFIAANMQKQRWSETESFKIIKNDGIQWAIKGDTSLNFNRLFGEYTENDYVMLQRRDNSDLYLGIQYPDDEVYRLVAR
jgi:hypothetical protein